MSSDFLFTKNLTLVSNREKCVLLSSMHHVHTIFEVEQNLKHEIIKYYNETKCGIDILEKLVTEYSCRRAFRYWSNTLFCNLLDIMT